MTEQTDLLLPKGEWVFDTEVTRVFDDMLKRSIPQYEVMRDSVDMISRKLLQPGGMVLDLGASRGEGVNRLIERYGARNRYHLVETSAPMAEVIRGRFSGLIEAGIVTVYEEDLRSFFPPVVPGSVDVVLCVLTLMFVPVQYRQEILRTSYEAVRPGGGIILVEKILGTGADAERFMVEFYHTLKREHGYSREQVEAKSRSLESVLVSNSEQENKEMLLGAGFKEVNCFWKWMNFAGYLGLKEAKEKQIEFRNQVC